MRRPEGFDRLEKQRSPADAPASGTRRAAGDAPVSNPASVPASASEPVRAPGAKRDSSSHTAPVSNTAPAATDASVSAPAPISIPSPDGTAAEARERARAARRLARRAAAARRAVERTEVRRFTRRTRHRRAAWITAAVVVVALIGAVTVSVFSPLLSLQTITIEGTSRVDRAAVLKSLDSEIGKPLAMVNFAAVKKDLSNFPLIESYVTETLPPHTLVIRITEREPIATVKVGKTFELVDPAGVVIQTSPKQPAGYPLVTVTGANVGGALYRSTAEVILSLPASLSKTVARVTASTADDVTLTLSTGEQVVWGSADSSTQKAELLAGLIKDHKARNPTQSVEYDVSAPDNGIIRSK